VVWAPHDREGRGRFGLRLRARLFDPINASVPVLVALFCLARPSGLIADIPYWSIAALLVSTLLVNSVGGALWSDATSGWRLAARVGVEMATIAIVVYGIGWGPILAIGFVYGAADTMRTVGSAATRPAMVWTLVCMGLGQLAVFLGLAPTLVHQPLVHGLSALAALGALLTMKLLDWFAHARETSEGRFRALVQHASDIIIVTDSAGQLNYVSPAFDRILGFSAREFGNRPASELMHPDDLARLRAEMTADALAAQGNGGWRTELRMRDGAGAWKWFESTVTDHLQDPNVRGIVANLHDISARKEAELALREAHERFRSAFENAPIGMAMADLEGRVMRANPAFGKIVGRRSVELPGLSLHELTHAEDREATSAAMRRLTTQETDGYRIEKRYLHVEGHEVWVSVSLSCVHNDDGPLYLIAQVEDVTERRALRERLAYAAIHDPLTQLPNRILFMDRLEVALSRAVRQNRQVAVIFMDLDRFKLVNDSMGHAAGDRLIEIVADRLRATVRPNDTVARFGGDEFIVLCEDVVGESVALGLADRLSGALAQPVVLAEGEVFVSASMGVAVSRQVGDASAGGDPDDSAASLLRDADTAMYRAKELGRARTEVFEEASHVVALQQIRTRSELHRALERREFRVFYQPIVEVLSGRLAGVEALVRWQHPERGLLHPGEFLSTAEESGLIVPIGALVLEEACQQLAIWHAERRRQGIAPMSLGVSVNLSPRQLVQPHFVHQVADILRSTAVDPGALWLEITEGALAGDAAQTIDTLEQLHALGVRLSIDDFGSGYASLGYLRSFPVEALKIDRSFVDGLGRGTEDSTIVASVVALARSLGLICIAEGVERSEQISQLVTLGCDYVQGFLLGVPLPADTLGDAMCDDLSAWAVNEAPLFSEALGSGSSEGAPAGMPAFVVPPGVVPPPDTLVDTRG